jgi:HK97 gp10 family phage protein
MKPKVNFKGLQKFSRQLEQLNEAQVSRFSEAAIKELAARLLAKAIKSTPVQSGYLQGSWTVGEVFREDGVCKIEVINPVEYASYVEFGHRTRNRKGWVDGKLMLTFSEQELLADAPGILQAKLDKFVRGFLA